MIEVRRKALENIQCAQERQKRYYDAKHCKDKEQYKVGAEVLLLNSKKLSPSVGADSDKSSPFTATSTTSDQDTSIAGGRMVVEDSDQLPTGMCNVVFFLLYYYHYQWYTL